MGGAQQPVGDRFSRGQVRRILGISERQWRAWERQGLVPPPRGEVADGAGLPASPAQRKKAAPSSSPDRLYTFSDILQLKTLLQLRREGIPPARIRLAHDALRVRLGEVERPWSELRFRAQGKHLCVVFQGATMEPLTGQLLLDYASGSHQSKIRTLRPPDQRKKQGEAERRARAERFFLAGLRYEERVETVPKAIRAYQKAIEWNPQAAGAYINLGTLYYHLGRLPEAEGCYRAALSIDPGYGLVHFNLGNVFDEKKEWDKAQQYYEQAITLDPNYADPHYNLALVYEKLGLHGKAREQWRAYLKLDPQSQWASYARQQLEKTGLRIIPGKKCSGDDS